MRTDNHTTTGRRVLDIALAQNESRKSAADAIFRQLVLCERETNELAGVLLIFEFWGIYWTALKTMD